MKGSATGIVIAAGVLSVVLSGCATTMKKNESDLQIQSLKGQVSELEARVQRKDAEIEALRETLSKSADEKYGRAKETSVPSQSPTLLQIQKALKNAGYDPGEIDGKMGRRTRSAIRAFQQANSLSPDGKVGAKTWEVLAPYLAEQKGK